MAEVLVAALVWVVSHLALATDPIRKNLVAAVGSGPFLGLYSLVATASLIYLIWVYTDVPRFDYMWLPNPDLYWVSKVTMPVALILLVGGFMVKNPTNVGMSLDDVEDASQLATGVTRITRHPFQWAVVIWGIGHVVANGDWVSIIFFTSFVVISGAGTFLMDRKKALSLGAGWTQYSRVTSNVPFAAIARGDNRLVWGELGLPALAGLVAYGVLYYFHEAITGSIII
ncbi:MAG: NnrU family protein [Pseudomonadota bacterium]